MSVVRTSTWKWDSLLDVEDKLLADDFKWFTRHFTFQYAVQTGFDISPRHFLSDDTLIVLLDGERLVVISVKR